MDMEVFGAGEQAWAQMVSSHGIIAGGISRQASEGLSIDSESSPSSRRSSGSPQAARQGMGPKRASSDRLDALLAVLQTSTLDEVKNMDPAAQSFQAKHLPKPADKTAAAKCGASGAFEGAPMLGRAGSFQDNEEPAMALKTAAAQMETGVSPLASAAAAAHGSPSLGRAVA